jgi:hypothetical protein
MDLDRHLPHAPAPRGATMTDPVPITAAARARRRPRYSRKGAAVETQIEQSARHNKPG